MKAWLARLGAPWRKLGALDGSLYLINRLLGHLSGGRAGLHKYYLVVQPVRPAAQALRPSADTVIAPAAPDSPLRASFPRPTEVIEQRYRDGALCFAAVVKAQFAGFLWLQRERYREDEVRCDYLLVQPAVSVWDYDVYVEPRYRLGRCLARLWDEANRHLQAEGVRWTFSRISAYNPASLKAHARLDARPLHSALFLCLGRLQFSWLPQAPHLHLSLGPQQRPRIPLAPPTELP